MSRSKEQLQALISSLGDGWCYMLKEDDFTTLELKTIYEIVLGDGIKSKNSKTDLISAIKTAVYKLRNFDDMNKVHASRGISRKKAILGNYRGSISVHRQANEGITKITDVLNFLCYSHAVKRENTVTASFKLSCNDNRCDYVFFETDEPIDMHALYLFITGKYPEGVGWSVLCLTYDMSSGKFSHITDSRILERSSGTEMIYAEDDEYITKEALLKYRGYLDRGITPLTISRQAKKAVRVGRMKAETENAYNALEIGLSLCHLTPKDASLVCQSFLGLIE